MLATIARTICVVVAMAVVASSGEKSRMERGLRSPLEARELASLVDREGAEAVLAVLYENQRLWDDRTEQIGTGMGPWLKLATRLRGVADAGASDELDLAMGEALEHAPEAVLRSMGQGFDVEGVCGNYGFLLPNKRTLTAITRPIESRRHLLRMVSRPELRTKRDACVARLGRLLDEVRRSFGQ